MRVAYFSVKVKVSTKKNDVVLAEGQYTQFEHESLQQPREFIPAQEAAWKNGEFYFNNVPLRQVIDELKRQFDIKILLDDDSSRTYTGYFNRTFLDNALVMVFNRCRFGIINTGIKLL